MSGVSGYRLATGTALGELAGLLDALPVASLMLSADGKALVANQAFATLVGLPSAAVLGEGWLDMVEPASRSAVEAALRVGAADNKAGYFDCRMMTATEWRLCRFQWRPWSDGRLIACVTGSGGGHETWPLAVEDGNLADAVALVVHRIFSVGLDLQSMVSRADREMAERLARAVTELDLIIRDTRSTIFRTRSSGAA